MMNSYNNACFYPLHAFLPGTTDHKQKATMRPAPDESEIRWLLTEASKYLSPDVHMRRKDVLSAW